MIQIIRVIITIVAITIFFVCLTGSGITIGVSILPYPDSQSQCALDLII